jgi:hypothetical protein
MTKLTIKSANKNETNYICFIFIFCLAFNHPILSQEDMSVNNSPAFSFESNATLIWTDQGRTSFLGGIGICNYWFLHSFGAKNSNFLGLDVITRFIFLENGDSEEIDDRVLNYRDQGSIALLLRWDRHLFGKRYRFGFFGGIGPEVRSNFKSDRYGFVPFMQQEIGINWQPSVKGSFLASNDIGLSVSLPLRREERQFSMIFGSLFTRFSF